MSAKTPLVLLPGLLCDAALWAHQTGALADVADITVADLTLDDSIGAMAERVLDAVPERFALAGLSMGGYVAQAIVRLAPERVERLALLDTSARADSPEKKEERGKLIGQLKLGDFKGVTSRLMPLLIHNDRLADEALTKTIMRSAENVGPDAYVRQQTAIMGRADGIEALKKVDCPALVLCGREDALTPLDHHEEMADNIPTAKLVIIEDCGHLAPLERPRAVSAVMRYWLQV